MGQRSKPRLRRPTQTFLSLPGPRPPPAPASGSPEPRAPLTEEHFRTEWPPRISGVTKSAQQPVAPGSVLGAPCGLLPLDVTEAGSEARPWPRGRGGRAARLPYIPGVREQLCSNSSARGPVCPKGRM